MADEMLADETRLKVIWISPRHAIDPKTGIHLPFRKRIVIFISIPEIHSWIATDNLL